MMTDYQFANAILDFCALQHNTIRETIVAFIRGDASLTQLVRSVSDHTDYETASCILQFLNTSVAL